MHQSVIFRRLGSLNHIGGGIPSTISGNFEFRNSDLMGAGRVFMRGVSRRCIVEVSVPKVLLRDGSVLFDAQLGVD